jgi:hypothetical protein
MVLGILAVWSAVVMSVLAFPATAAAGPCPPGQVPVAGGGFCVPLSPLFPAPTTPGQSPTATPASPAPTGPVPGEPVPSATSPVVMDSGSQAPGSSPTEPGQSPAAGAATPSSSESSPMPASLAPPASTRAPSETTHPETAAGASRGGPAARPQAPSTLIPLAGYLLAFGGMMLLASSAVGLMRQRPATW